MMILRSTPPSPFGRKVKLAASVLGLSGEIKVEPADPNDATDSLRQQNPLGKIPTLVLEDGSTLFDSRVILEYLDHRAGGGKIIPQRAQGALCRAAAAGAGRRHDRRADPAGLRRPLPAAGASRARNGSTTRPTRSSAGSPRSKPIRRRSTRSPMSARSRSPASSATAICASPATGAPAIRSSSAWLDRFAAQGAGLRRDQGRGIAEHGSSRVHLHRIGGVLALLAGSRMLTCALPQP